MSDKENSTDETPQAGADGGEPAAQSTVSASSADQPAPGNGGGGMTAAEFGDLNETPSGEGAVGWDLQMLRDIPVTLSVEVGRSAISINNLLQLSQGSVVELDRAAGEALDVMVNGCLVAHGEVVVVNDRFGIRLTDVVSPTERVKKLN